VREGLFNGESCPEYILDQGCETPIVGQVLTQATDPWWKVPYDGTVIEIKVDGHCTKVRAEYTAPLMSGDKLSTSHGQKGVAVVVEHMPIGIDIDTGDTVEFDVCSSVVSVVNRVCPGQIMEGQQGRGPGGFHGVCNVVSNGGTVMSCCEGNKPVEASYGTIVMWQLIHRTVEKTHYTHVPPTQNDLVIRKGRARGGGLRCSEMEILSMMCSKRLSITREILNNRDMCLTPVCTKCNRLGLYCTHDDDSTFVLARVPHSTMLLNEYMMFGTGMSLVMELETVNT
jgi:DNA-directed RNA polymerase beta subunit